MADSDGRTPVSAEGAFISEAGECVDDGLDQVQSGGSASASQEARVRSAKTLCCQ